MIMIQMIIIVEATIPATIRMSVRWSSKVPAKITSIHFNINESKKGICASLCVVCECLICVKLCK